MKVSDRAITLARSFIGKTETANNDAPWLETLMHAGGNPAKWVAGEAYCIAALLAIFDMACSAESKTFPIMPSASSQVFYENAEAAKLVSMVPDVGDIVIFKLGDTWQGHAGLVTNILRDSRGFIEAIDTIEFNTAAPRTPNSTPQSERDGQGCYAKHRIVSHFPKTDKKQLWIRGYVKTSQIQ
jgi:hypothetical protein